MPHHRCCPSARSLCHGYVLGITYRRDDGEADEGIPSCEIRLIDADGNLIAATTATDSNGDFTIDGVVPGSGFTLKQIDSGGTDNGTDLTTISLDLSGSDITGLVSVDEIGCDQASERCAFQHSYCAHQSETVLEDTDIDGEGDLRNPWIRASSV